jgi:predicted phage tail protein
VGDIVQGVLQWGNFGSQVVDNIVNIYRAGVLQYSVRTPANECVLTGLVAGSYEARVQAIAANGVGSSISTLAFTIAVPATPTSVSVIPDNWSLQLIPKFQNQLSFGTICEFFWSTVNLTLNQVEAQATNLGMGATLTHSGLQPDTTYYYWIRSINSYGKSAFFALSAKTTYDISSILDAMDGEIGAEHLRQELRTEIEKIPGLSDGYNELFTKTADINQLVSGMQSSYYAQGMAGLEAATANAEDDHKKRAALGQATREIKTVANAQTAMGQIIDQTRAELNGNIAATQTVQESVVNLSGEVRASWYGKAQVNGVGGGFGLEVVMQPDGSSLASFVVDADVFAILSRAHGATSKRNPFVVKNGTVYMNHVMMDTAEIGSVIAKYINVTSLNAVTITASTITSSTINSSTLNSAVLNSSQINGGSLSISNKFIVDTNGNVTIRNAPNGIGMALSNNRIDVRDDNNVLRVRIGLL